MNKIQFLTELEKRLEGLTETDIQTSLDFYSEITTSTGDIKLKIIN